jgi:hypothetical protein
MDDNTVNNTDQTSEAKKEVNQIDLWDAVKQGFSALGSQLGRLMQAGNRRRLVLRRRENKLFELPLSATVIVLLIVMVIAQPLFVLLALTTVIALLLDVRFFVVRQETSIESKQAERSGSSD